MKAITQPRPGLATPQERDAALLAPYAMHSADSAGRVYPEPEQAYRSVFQRDRDRILHSAAYRRLAGKTQVFTGDRGDYHRTRLTHTLEVSSIARTIGRALRLNEDLIEALALLHDLGHPPFGHAGEDALNECLAEAGGFSHNRQALVIVEELETRRPDFPGLNLTREVLSGQRCRAERSPAQPTPLLEVQVVELADSITYNAHDTDDAIKLGLVKIEEFAAAPLAGDCMARVLKERPSLEGKMLRKALVHELIDHQVGAILTINAERLASTGLASAAEVIERGFALHVEPAIAAQKAKLEAFLYRRVYRHPQLMAERETAQRRLACLFQSYVQEPAALPPQFQERAQQVGLLRSVGDYVAGMTDSYFREQYARRIRSADGGSSDSFEC